MDTLWASFGANPVTSFYRRFNQWLNDPTREAARLTRDARHVLDKIVALYAAEQAAKVAVCLSKSLLEAREAIGAAPSRRLDVVREIQRRHRTARRRNDQPELSGLTLVLIALHADELGEAGSDTRLIIDGFLEQWKHLAVDAADERT
ncbi:MAG: hypothetical protein ACR2RL_15125 [Gammaproteobacteria bacterium]